MRKLLYMCILLLFVNICYPPLFASTVLSTSHYYTFEYENTYIQSFFFNSIQSLVNLKNPPKKSLSKKTASTLSTITITGKCYLGSGTTHPIDTGAVAFCIKSVNGSDYGAYWDWNKYSSRSSIISKGGNLNADITNVEKGDNYILIDPKGYSLQWWDGKNVFEQPSIVAITGDTLFCEFHFTPGCTLNCTIANSKYYDYCYLLDNAGFSIARSTQMGLQDTAQYVVSDIPVGNYYLDMLTSYIENPFYPNANLKKNAAIITFSTAGTLTDSLKWTLIDKPATPPVDTAWLQIAYPFSNTNRPWEYLIGIDSKHSNLSQRSSDTSVWKLESNRKYFVCEYFSGQNRVVWYPGTYFQAEAETLSLQPNESRTITITDPSVYFNISGTLPVFTDPSFSFLPILTREHQKQSLGAAITVNDTTGRFSAIVVPGRYNLWNVPVTDGYKRGAGWGAFRVDSVNVDSIYGFSDNINTDQV